MPKLRFKNNLGCLYEIPDEVVLADVFDKVKATNKDGENKNVITNSAEYGLIPQRDFFDKDIAVEGNTEKYTIIEKGDFVYNPRKSTTAPYGPFNCYNREEPGIVSPLYSCLKPKDHSLTPYLLHYFSSPAWYSYIYHNGNQGGARHDRVGMTDELLMGIPVLLPCSEEREKISKFLSLYDEKISIQKRKVKALEIRRKGLLQQIFSQEIRFKADDDSEFDDWNEVTFGELIDPFTIKTKEENEDTLLSCAIDGMFLNTELFDHQRGASNIGYLKVEKGTLILSAQNLHLGNANVNLRFEHGIISPAYKTYKVVGCLPEFMAIWVKREAAKRFFFDATTTGASECRRNVDWDKLYSQTLLLPSEPEQKKIYDFIKLIDEQIQVEKDKLEALKNVKKGLLQQMFV